MSRSNRFIALSLLLELGLQAGWRRSAPSPQASERHEREERRLAEEEGSTSITAELIKKCGSPTAELQYAAENGCTETVAELVEKGADPNAKNKNGRTALVMAAENGHSGTVAALLAHGADLNATIHNGSTLCFFKFRVRTDLFY